jgi:hypothetical protein
VRFQIMSLRKPFKSAVCCDNKYTGESLECLNVDAFGA